MNGSQAMAVLTDKYPHMKVIILSSYREQALMDDYFLRGAKGYVLKSELAGAGACRAKRVQRRHLQVS